MKWEMEILSSYLSNASWLIDESKSTKWTQYENKMFENALAVYDKDTPDRWQRVAAMIPGKTVADVIKQYKELEDDVSNIEAGLIPIPGYNSTSVFTLEWVNNNNVCDGYNKHAYGYTPCGKRGPGSTRPADHERKKGIPWTEEEHKLFLMGLKKYGKGDWRNISRNFVITRTPTQVASHAQKYFIRQLSGGKDKRRASIHDITTVNIEIENENNVSLDHTNSNKPSISPEHSTMTVQSHQSSAWEQHKGSGGGIGFDSMQGNELMAPYGVASYGFKTRGQSLQSRDFLDNFIGSQSIGFEIQSNQQYPHG